MHLQVAITPPMTLKPQDRVCIVIDVLRATSSLSMMMKAGVSLVCVAPNPDAALAFVRGSANPYLLAGEVGGLPPAGFDTGNSPREFSEMDLRGRQIVFSTSNGTRALRALQESPRVVTGSFLNASAAVRAALAYASRGGLDLAIVCSGVRLGMSFALDDTVCAGYLAGQVMARFARHDLSFLPEFAGETPTSASWTGETLDVDEGGVAAYQLFRSYVRDPFRPTRDELFHAFSLGSSARDLFRVDLRDDVRFCTQVDITDAVPEMAPLGASPGRYPVSLLDA